MDHPFIKRRKSKMIQPNDKMPDIPLRELIDGKPAEISSGALFSQGRTLLFAVPGAFTPTCSAAHLPGFVAHADALRAKGIDQIVCLSVNDAYVMQAWGREHNAIGQVRMLADGNGALTCALGMDKDATAAGMGLRSHRYALLVEDGAVRELAFDAPGTFENSSAEAMLARL